MADALTLTAHALDRAVGLAPTPEGRLRGAASPAYWNRAGAFGGMTAAILLNAVLGQEKRNGRPLAQTVNFCAALVDAPFEIEVRLERDGRSTQHWNVTLVQNDQVTATGSVVTGAERQTWGHQLSAPPEAPPADQLQPMNMGANRNWMANYDMRYIAGSPREWETHSRDNPGSGVTQVWLRDTPNRPLDYLALAAMADAFAPRIMLVRGELAPAATVSLSTYFLADEAEVRSQGDRHILGIAAPRSVAHGFHDQSAELWSDNGKLLVVSHQMVWFKE